MPKYRQPSLSAFHQLARKAARKRKERLREVKVHVWREEDGMMTNGSIRLTMEDFEDWKRDWQLRVGARGILFEEFLAN